MPESTLQRARTLLPGCRFIQKYGTTEFGSPRTRSREDGSVWFRMDSPGYEFKIVDGTLWVRSSSSMIGYLNAPNPFDEDGWMNTGDLVEKDGDYIRVLGRKTDLINVGGHKVLPQEVEDVILRMDNVSDVAVTAEKNAMMGQVVAAHVTLSAPEDANGFKARLRAHCRQHLPSYKIPVRVEIADAPLAGARMKKSRLPAGQPET
jgi:acyl-CoA synthetase (AMP-forming)/AMP-acid ligase II